MTDAPAAAARLAIADESGPGAPPRRNGELVFDAPWEARAFGLAVAMAQDGVYDWETFRGRLIEEIGAWESSHASDTAAWDYYERWLSTLERVVVERGLLSPGQIDRRMREIAHAEQHEHDHDHDHDHDHA